MPTLGSAPDLPAAPAVAPTPWPVELEGVLLIILVIASAIAFSWGLRRVARVRVLVEIHPWLPLVHIVAWCGALWVLFRPALADPAAGRAYLWLAALTVFVIAGLPWLRNVLAGVVLVIERRYRVGDDLRVGSTTGRATSFGMRSVVLRTALGTEVRVPYQQFLAEPVERLNLRARDSPCEIRVRVPDGVALAEAMEAARLAATLSPLASPRLAPEIFVTHDVSDSPQVVLGVRAFAFDREHEARFISDLLARIHAALVVHDRAG